MMFDPTILYVDATNVGDFDEDHYQTQGQRWSETRLNAIQCLCTKDDNVFGDVRPFSLYLPGNLDSFYNQRLSFETQPNVVASSNLYRTIEDVLGSGKAAVSQFHQMGSRVTLGFFGMLGSVVCVPGQIESEFNSVPFASLDLTKAHSLSSLDELRSCSTILVMNSVDQSQSFTHYAKKHFVTITLAEYIKYMSDVIHKLKQDAEIIKPGGRSFRQNQDRMQDAKTLLARAKSYLTESPERPGLVPAKVSAENIVMEMFAYQSIDVSTIPYQQIPALQLAGDDLEEYLDHLVRTKNCTKVSVVVTDSSGVYTRVVPTPMIPPAIQNALKKKHKELVKTIKAAIKAEEGDQAPTPVQSKVVEQPMEEDDPVAAVPEPQQKSTMVPSDGLTAQEFCDKVANIIIRYPDEPVSKNVSKRAKKSATSTPKKKADQGDTPKKKASQGDTPKKKADQDAPKKKADQDAPKKKADQDAPKKKVDQDAPKKKADQDDAVVDDAVVKKPKTPKRPKKAKPVAEPEESSGELDRQMQMLTDELDKVTKRSRQVAKQTDGPVIEDGQDAIVEPVQDVQAEVDIDVDEAIGSGGSDSSDDDDGESSESSSEEAEPVVVEKVVAQKSTPVAPSRKKKTKRSDVQEEEEEVVSVHQPIQISKRQKTSIRTPFIDKCRVFLSQCLSALILGKDRVPSERDGWANQIFLASLQRQLLATARTFVQMSIPNTVFDVPRSNLTDFQVSCLSLLSGIVTDLQSAPIDDKRVCGGWSKDEFTRAMMDDLDATAKTVMHLNMEEEVTWHLGRCVNQN